MGPPRPATAALAEFVRGGVNDEALAADLQREGTEAFAKSWSDLMYRISREPPLVSIAGAE